MIKILDNEKKIVAYLKHVKDAYIKRTTKNEFTLSFTTIVEELKSEYLYDPTNVLLADGELFRVRNLKDVSTRDGMVTIQVFAEHISYDLLNRKILSFNYTGTVLDLMYEALKTTMFALGNTDIFGTATIKEEKEVTARYIVNKIAEMFNAEINWRKDEIDILSHLGEEKNITFTVKRNLIDIGREIDNAELDEDGNPSVQYTINVDAQSIDELYECNLGDTIRVFDEKLNINTKRRIISIEKDIVLNKNKKVTLGDPRKELSDVITDMASKNSVITEVIHQQVINVETAHILNAWIKNLFVEYLETNMDARINGYELDRHFIRIEGVREEMVQQILDEKLVEDLLIPNPSGSGDMINVYFTAIGEHKDAYKYFTITNPKDIYEDLTDKEIEAFKVKVKKIIKENIKYSKAFKELEMSNGTKTVTPVETWGAGTDVTGTTDKGKAFVFKDLDAYVIRYVKENGENVELRVGEGGIQVSGDAYLEFANIPLQPEAIVKFEHKYLHMPTITCNAIGSDLVPTITHTTDGNLYIGCTVTYNGLTTAIDGAKTAIQVVGKGVS